MQSFKTIFQFELTQMRKKKVQIVTTSILVVLMFGFSFIPLLFNKSNEDTTHQQPTLADVFEQSGFVYDNPGAVAAFSVLNEQKTFETVTKLEEALEKGDIAVGFVIKSPVAIEVLASTNKMPRFEMETLRNLAHNVEKEARLIQAGLDPQKVSQAEQIEVDMHVTQFGKQEVPALALAIGIMFMLYTVLLLYGQLVATAVAREKDSRTMELLITSTKPKTLIIGKVCAVGLFSAVQIFLIIGSFVVGFLINQNGYPEVIRAMISGSMSMDVIAVYIIFSFSGYILYLFIYAAMGSLVSKVEDVGAAVGPITFLFVIAYLIATMAMSMPDLSLVVISSYIPFVSLFTMPIRYMLSSVSILSLAISLTIMVVTTYLCAALSVYIYSYGSLNYGNKLKLKDIIKTMVKK